MWKTCQYKPDIVAEVPHIKLLHLIMYRTEVHVLNMLMNVQNILLVFHNLVCKRTVQLALGTALMLEYLSDNITSKSKILHILKMGI